MPASRKRTKQDPALAGIHGAVVAKSPREWPAARRAAWCRAYLAGAASPELLNTPREHADMRMAFRQGQKEAASSTAAVAQAKKQTGLKKARRERYAEQRDAAMRGSVLSRLDALTGGGMLSPHDDPIIRSLAGAALGAGMTLARRSDDR